jgi:hypothetical protein
MVESAEEAKEGKAKHRAKHKVGLFRATGGKGRFVPATWMHKAGRIDIFAWRQAFSQGQSSIYMQWWDSCTW